MVFRLSCALFELCCTRVVRRTPAFGNFWLRLACGTVVVLMLHRLWHSLQQRRDRQQDTHSRAPAARIVHNGRQSGQDLSAWPVDGSECSFDSHSPGSANVKLGRNVQSIPDPREFSIPKAPLWDSRADKPRPEALSEPPQTVVTPKPPLGRIQCPSPSHTELAEIGERKFDVQLGDFVDDIVTSGAGFNRLQI